MKERETLVHRLRRTRASFLNLFGRNDADRWNQAFAEGQWTLLDSPHQCPRHYVIAGMLRATGGVDAGVLDVGCGTGALVPHLPANVTRYVGIDIASEAVRICRDKHLPAPGRSFETAAFDAYVPSEPFDVIVFNEMLYYYPVGQIPEVLAHARSVLKRGAGTIIVSVHNRSVKRFHVWRALAANMSAVEATVASNRMTGLSWRIVRYPS